MTPLKPEHQGEGTYDWACRDAGCWYCEAMGLTPMQPIYYAEEVQLFSYKNSEPQRPPIVERRRCNGWNQSEIRIIEKFSKFGSRAVWRLLPNRTLIAVQVKMCHLRNAGLCA